MGIEDGHHGWNGRRRKVVRTIPPHNNDPTGSPTKWEWSSLFHGNRTHNDDDNVLLIRHHHHDDSRRRMDNETTTTTTDHGQKNDTHRCWKKGTGILGGGLSVPKNDKVFGILGAILVD